MPGSNDPGADFAAMAGALTADNGSGAAAAAAHALESELRQKEHDLRNAKMVEPFKAAAESTIDPPAPPRTTKREILRKAIEHTISCESIDTMAETPDFILAEFLDYVLGAVISFNERREKWFGYGLRIGGPVKLELRTVEDCQHRSITSTEGGAHCNECGSVMNFDHTSGNWIPMGRPEVPSVPATGKPCPSSDNDGNPVGKPCPTDSDTIRASKELLGPELCQEIGMSMGFASVCWNPRPAGIFDSSTCAQATDELIVKIAARVGEFHSAYLEEVQDEIRAKAEIKHGE